MKSISQSPLKILGALSNFSGINSNDAMEDWSKMTFTWPAKDMQIVQQMMDRYDLDLELLKVLGTRAQTAKNEREVRHAQGKDWINAGK